MSVLLPALAMSAYLIATAAVLLRLFHPTGPSFKLTFSAGITGIMLHMLHLTGSIFTEQGQNFSLLNVSSLLSWMITVAVTLTALRTHTILLLPVVYSFAALMQLTIIFTPAGSPLLPLDANPSLLAHILIAFIAYVLLIMGTLYSFQVSYISYKLKHKNFTSMNQFLPPLMQAEALQFRLLLVGTLLLGLALLSGAVFTDNWLSKANLHKNLLSSAAFMVFAVLCWGHARLGWRGRTAISMTLVGSILLTLGYFGSRFVREVLLSSL